MKFMKPEEVVLPVVPEAAIVEVSLMVVVGGFAGALEMKPVGSERGRAITLSFWRDLRLRREKQGVWC